MTRRLTASLAIAACVAGSACSQGRAPSADTGPPPPAYVEHRKQALSLYAAGDFRAALREAVQAFAAAPGRREAYETISKLYIDSGLDGEAVQFFELAAKKFPDRAEPWYFRGYHAFRLQRWADARASFEKAAALGPGDAETHFRLGLLLQGQGDFDGAESHLGRAFELSATSALYATRYARVLRIAGKYDDAAKVVDAGLRSSPDAADLWYAASQLRGRSGDDSGAEDALRRALALHPGHKDAHYDLARLLLRTGRQEEGVREQAIAARLDRYVTAKDQLTRQIGAHPKDASLALQLAELELSERRVTEALRWFARAETLGGPSDRIIRGRASAERERDSGIVDAPAGDPATP